MKTVTFYQVVVKKKSFTYKILKRFSDFAKLHSDFSVKYGMAFEKFPSKVTFYKSQESVLKERRACLEIFVNELRREAVRNLDSIKYPELYDFLELANCKR